MNTNDIRRLLHIRCSDSFIGVFARDKLPITLPHRRPLMLVCNTDPHDKPGEHWIAIYIGIDTRGEYFDSLGAEPHITFKRYLDRYCKSWITSGKQLQSVLTHFCGHYCVFYCLYKTLGYNMESIVNCFTNDTTLNDWMVHKFVCDAL